jgi:hypothetical protein
MLDFIMVLALISVVWGMVSAIAIASFLSNRGHKIDVLLFRFKLFKYIRQYAEITTQEEGQPGFWYRSFTISMTMVLILVIFGLYLKFII